MIQALLLARTLQDADDSAVLDWKWDRSGELRPEWRRPDTGERVRWVPDLVGTLNGLRWNTRVYLGRDWRRRNDALQLDYFVGNGFFIEGDPELPPPRRKATGDARTELNEVRRILARIGQGR